MREAERWAARLKELEAKVQVAANLRRSIGYAYISESAVFTFITEWDRLTKAPNGAPANFSPAGASPTAGSYASLHKSDEGRASEVSVNGE